VWDGMWVVRLLQRDVVTVMWKGKTTQVVCCLLLVWDGKWVERLLERDVAIGLWRGRNNTGSVRTGWPRSHRTPRKYAPQTQYKFTMRSAARSTV